MSKNMVEQMALRAGLVRLHAPKHTLAPTRTHTHTEIFNTYCFSTATLVTWTRLNVALHSHLSKLTSLGQSSLVFSHVTVLPLCAGHSEGPTGAGRVRGALYGPATGEQRLGDPEGHPAGASLERHQRGPSARDAGHHGDALRRRSGLHRPWGFLLRRVYCVAVP